MNVNKIIMAGNLTRDPQLSYLPSQTAVVAFGIAVNRKWSGKDGVKKEEVCFIDCVCFGKIGETINKYIQKGDPLFIEGRLKFESWTAQDGSKRSKHKIVVESFQFINTGAQGKAETASAPKSEAKSTDDIPF